MREMIFLIPLWFVFLCCSSEVIELVCAKLLYSYHEETIQFITDANYFKYLSGRNMLTSRFIDSHHDYSV